MSLERTGDVRRPAIVEVDDDDISTTNEPMDDAK